MTNATMKTFGFPDTLVRQFDHWALLVRPAQVTLGSMVLVETSEATAFGQLKSAAYAELGHIIPAVETLLKDFVSYEKINYIMLMMVDPNVHFHIIPRYSGSRKCDDLELIDAGWPGPPDLKSAILPNAGQLARLRTELLSRID